MSTGEQPPQPDSSRPPTAEALARLAAAGDDDAFEALHRRLGGGLRRFIERRLGGPPDLIEEVCQHTWVEVWRAFRERRYDPQRARISTFVYAIGYKLVLRQHRARQRSTQPLLPDDADPALRLAAPHAEALHFSELLDALRDCLHRTGTPFELTPEERAIATESAARISERVLAQRLGLAASTVNARKKSAYAKLRQCLMKKGFSADQAERWLD